MAGGFRVAVPADAGGTGRDRIDDPKRRERVLGYLRGAAPVADGLRTDGVWIWPASVEDQLADHGVAPEPDLYARIAHAGYRCPPVTARMVDRARAALTGSADG
jgi:hypothetical protein